MAYRDVSVWLEDVLMAIERIKKHTITVNSYSEYIKSQLIMDATERNLEIIAEAVKNAIKLNSELPISNASKIIGLRNIINHEYYKIEYDRIWIIIKKDLPILEKEIKKILEDFERRLELNEL
ncbi:MAG: HepT-like ribonuclease domain-containing protein [Chitinophagaceae bacterium]